jgi:hypothetical protein
VPWGQDVTLGLALQPIISDGRGRLQRRLHIPRFDELPLCLRLVRPDAGKAIRLQLPSLFSVAVRENLPGVAFFWEQCTSTRLCVPLLAPPLASCSHPEGYLLRDFFRQIEQLKDNVQDFSHFQD